MDKPQSVSDNKDNAKSAAQEYEDAKQKQDNMKKMSYDELKKLGDTNILQINFNVDIAKKKLDKANYDYNKAVSDWINGRK